MKKYSEGYTGSDPDQGLKEILWKALTMQIPDMHQTQSHYDFHCQPTQLFTTRLGGDIKLLNCKKKLSFQKCPKYLLKTQPIINLHSTEK